MAEQQIQPGIYKARGIRGSHQIGYADTGSPQVAVDVKIPALGGLEQTIVLPFGGDAGKFSIDRLKAMGWDGVDIRQCAGIDKNDVDVELFYDTFEGRQRMKCEIRLATTFKLKNVMAPGDADTFASDVAALASSGKAPDRLRAGRAVAEWDGQGPEPTRTRR